MDSFGKNNLYFNGFVITIYGCVKMPPQIKLSFEQTECYGFRTGGKQKRIAFTYVFSYVDFRKPLFSIIQQSLSEVSELVFCGIR